VAIDGKGNVWVTNAAGNSVSEISGATSTLAYSPATGYQAGNVTGAAAIAVEASGDVWIANQTGNNVMQIVGAATPATTPLSAQKPGVQP
jgi:streptogramin lyase